MIRKIFIILDYHLDKATSFTLYFFRLASTILFTRDHTSQRIYFLHFFNTLSLRNVLARNEDPLKLQNISTHFSHSFALSITP